MMSISVRALAIVIPLVVAGVTSAGIASADTDQRCTSTFCSLVSGLVPGREPSTTKPAPRKPDVSGTPASNSNYWAETRGGLLGGLAGEPEQCTSKTCNLYYGDTPPEDASADAAVTIPTVAETAPAESYDAPRAARGRGNVVADGERSSCEPSPQDPWRCYRR